MEIEVFETEREFNNKYKGGLYVCPMCRKTTPNAKYCIHCGFRADGLFKTLNNGYKYKIKEKGEKIYEIFKPIEL